MSKVKRVLKLRFIHFNHKYSCFFMKFNVYELFNVFKICAWVMLIQLKVRRPHRIEFLIYLVLI